jgi:hypothetical protein
MIPVESLYEFTEETLEAQHMKTLVEYMQSKMPETKSKIKHLSFSLDKEGKLIAKSGKREIEDFALFELGPGGNREDLADYLEKYIEEKKLTNLVVTHDREETKVYGHVRK